jgi:hypothetical protein
MIDEEFRCDVCDISAERDKICDILYCNQCTDEEKVSGIKTIIKDADK